jgi:hypothetical protein
MTVRREIAKPHRETGRGGQGTGSIVFGSACPTTRTGIGARKQGASSPTIPGGSEGRARRPKARHSSGSAIAEEAFMNNGG